MSLVDFLERFRPLPGHAFLSPDGHRLQIKTPRFHLSLPSKDIIEVRVCRMVDEFNHGDEEFHILIHRNGAILLGSFLNGALGAIDALMAQYPAIPVHEYQVGRVPFFARESGLFGKSLFPIPGTVMTSLERLDEFDMSLKRNETPNAEPDFSRLDVWESNHWIVRLHPNQCYLGRCTVIAKRECDDSLATCSDAEYLDLRNVLKVFEQVMSKRFSPKRFNYTQLGNEWQQLHVHAIPRYEEDPDWNGVNIPDDRWGKNPTPKGPPPFPVSKVYELADDLKDEFKRNVG